MSVSAKSTVAWAKFCRPCAEPLPLNVTFRPWLENSPIQAVSAFDDHVEPDPLTCECVTADAGFDENADPTLTVKSSAAATLSARRIADNVRSGRRCG